ncbi:RraA family protein [Roseicyclus persicicus]|uniref:Putative 4-hydroxy-4-methyl-2-oxoglutarate aldolase n=1 Tax=Roseicyclus persicicus TaxID=2650661 RepID=A0A7X6GYI8_9RHOB|nr:dimethylmenaquinone methyltransferase [Roseibacterium persicicum]NKX44762.1 dimethylmenaquinone methyltransferase [Roseibacterium persicicum]
MSVTLHPAPAPLPDAALAPWREVPVALAVDCAPGARQIDPAIRPLRPAGQQPRLFGRAVTVQVSPPDFGAMLYALDVAGPGDVLVVDAGGDAVTAMIGEILSGHLRRRGVAGIVLDGAVRDVGTLAGWEDFAVFARHVTPRGPTGAAGGTLNAKVTVGGVTVAPGDLILGDDDGLVCLPPATVRDGLGPVQAKAGKETEWERRLAAGESAAAVFGLAPPARG